MDDLGAFEQTVLEHSPPGALIVGSSISPDGRYGAALTYLPTAQYLMDDVFERDGESWMSYGGGGGGGISWTSLYGGDRGVLRFGDEAPAGATVARVVYESVEHRVPVRNGHFLFVAWDTRFAEDPQISGFD